jgi:coenzyme F420-reducing hydrogenase gamma subunit
MPDYKLVEKIVRAKVKLEAARRRHSDRCPVDMDPEYMGPCTCGASSSNSAIDSALKELELE